MDFIPSFLVDNIAIPPLPPLIEERRDDCLHLVLGFQKCIALRPATARWDGIAFPSFFFQYPVCSPDPENGISLDFSVPP